MGTWSDGLALEPFSTNLLFLVNFSCIIMTKFGPSLFVPPLPPTQGLSDY